jgi:hypothetical protein
MEYFTLEGTCFMTKTTTAKSSRARAISVDTETVAQILERERDPVIHDWLAPVEKQADLMAIPLTYQDRTAHLPQLLTDVIARLRLDASTTASISLAAGHHGNLRRQQGYSAAMLVEESRILEVCLFTTLHKNATQLDYEQLLPDVVTIADEVDAQLKVQMLRYIAGHAVGSQLVVH